MTVRSKSALIRSVTPRSHSSAQSKNMRTLLDKRVSREFKYCTKKKLNFVAITLTHTNTLVSVESKFLNYSRYEDEC